MAWVESRAARSAAGHGVRDMRVEASAIQAQNGRHLSILVRKGRGPFVGQDGILRPSGTRPFRCRNGANRRTGPRHQEACHPAPQNALSPGVHGSLQGKRNRRSRLNRS
jgi:hypothetical protein